MLLLSMLYVVVVVCSRSRTAVYRLDMYVSKSLSLSSDTSVPLNYYSAFHALQSALPDDAHIVSEGANTMDIGRAFLNNRLPRCTQTDNMNVIDESR